MADSALTEQAVELLKEMMARFERQSGGLGGVMMMNGGGSTDTGKPILAVAVALGEKTVPEFIDAVRKFAHGLPAVYVRQDREEGHG